MRAIDSKETCEICGAVYNTKEDLIDHIYYMRRYQEQEISKLTKKLLEIESIIKGDY